MAKVDPVEKELFFQAMELEDSVSVQNFLDQKCGNDLELKRRLEDLLRHHETDDRILDQTIVRGDTEREFGEPKAGDVIGHYRLLEKIGEGGMGLVFRANSDRLDSEVALKVIKLGMDTKRVVARFQAESQSLAVMDHPAITKVLEAGSTAEGRPYFVMELVDGKPIHKFCESHDLSLQARLDLFIQVCDGVQHAHQKGIIHRDLKPSNVLVQKSIDLSQTVDLGSDHRRTGEGQPKIIDFGIAKAMDQSVKKETLFTTYGEFLGTPAFMSPEQASGNSSLVDTRSDVYSLGALLYKTLTGCSPFRFQGKGISEIQKQIQEETPELPSAKITKVATEDKQRIDSWQVRGDLDWVVMKCLAKKPSDRYASPKELVDDLKRFINGDPVEAAAPSKWYQLKKFAAKNVPMLVTSAALVLFVIAGWIYSSVQAVQSKQLAQRAINAEKETKRSLHETEVARKEAEKERDRAIEAEKKLQDLIRRQRKRTAFYKTIIQMDPNVRVQRPKIAAKKGIPAFRLQPTLASMEASNVEERGTIVATFGDEEVTLPWRKLVVPKKGNLEKGNTEKPAQLSHTRQITIPFLERLLEEQRKELGPDDHEVKATLRLLAESYLEVDKVAHATEKLCECYEIAKDTDWLRHDKSSIGPEFADVITNSEKVKECRSVLTEVKTKIESEDPKAEKLKRAIDQILQRLENVDQNKNTKPSKVKPSK